MGAIETDDGFYRRMAQRAAKRRSPQTPTVLRGELPAGSDDEPRDWCTSCGLADAAMSDDVMRPTPPCLRCGSKRRWYGRLADRDGTANGPPSGPCLECYEWRRFPAGQEHFGWAWWRICADCGCAHHETEIWIA